MTIASLWRRVTGRPLATDEATKEQITPIEGLPALSLDALTSVACGPEAIALVLATAGASALHLMFPITVAIVVLLAILVFSYRQVIDAYPGGGGAYAVSKENLGTGASQLAAAALIVDYVLTVAVSIAAGVGALTSAFTGLHHYAVGLCLVVLALITVMNLRGLGEGARAFLGPTIAFIAGIGAVIVVGLVHPVNEHGAQPGRSLVATRNLEAVSLLLVLRAFAAGCSALTGVEAIAKRGPVVPGAPGGEGQADGGPPGGHPGGHTARSGRAGCAVPHRAADRADGAEPHHCGCAREELGLLRREHHHDHRARAGRQHVVRRAARPQQPARPRQLHATFPGHPG
jgi:hypothetical protein